MMFKQSAFKIGFLWLVLLAQFQFVFANPNPAPDSIPSLSWVVLNGDSLFPVTASPGPFSADERATGIQFRLEQLLSNPEFSIHSLHIQPGQEYDLIAHKKDIIMSIIDVDTLGTGLSRSQLTQLRMQDMISGLEQQVELYSDRNWLIRAGLAVLWIIGLWLIIFLINRLFKWMAKKVLLFEKKSLKKRRNILRYISPKGPGYFFVFLLRIVKYILILFILFAYLPLLFSLFPRTRHIVELFYSYISEPVHFVLIGLWNFLPNLFFIIIIFLMARYVARILALLAREIENDKLKLKGFHKDWAKPTQNILKIIIYAFALIFMFPYLPGSNSPAFQGISIFFGVLLSLGSTSAISNVIAGLVITYMRPFTLGDRVKVGPTIGDVIEKSLLVTKLRTLKNEEVTIPNSTIINNQLLNFSSNSKNLGLILYTSVTIGYDVPWEQVHKMLQKAARETKLLQRDPKPFVLQKSLNDYSIAYELNVFTKQEKKMPVIYSDLHAHIQDAFASAGIEILSPLYVASRDGNETKVPEVKVPPKNPVEKIIDKATGKKEF